MPRLLTIVERKLGDRCCTEDALPVLSYGDARAVAADLEVLAHPVRLQLLDVLARHEGEACVCDLEAAVPVKQPTVSHHLRLLREAGLVECEKRGVWAFYRVSRPAMDALGGRIRERLRALSAGESGNPHAASAVPSRLAR